MTAQTRSRPADDFLITDTVLVPSLELFGRYPKADLGKRLRAIDGATEIDV
ncbi:hypothetical protein MCHIJ_11100 [Mycolicibacterium chitae]|nr:hypothetical protein MCHIJ_11100 [Mycolicibacterium chitae]